MSIEFPNNPQHKRKAHVLLMDKQGRIIRNKRVEMWEGAPIGDWYDFHGMRIALHRVEGDFEGIVPDREV
jgi:hypothetical protein